MPFAEVTGVHALLAAGEQTAGGGWTESTIPRLSADGGRSRCRRTQRRRAWFQTAESGIRVGAMGAATGGRCQSAAGQWRARERLLEPLRALAERGRARRCRRLQTDEEGASSWRRTRHTPAASPALLCLSLLQRASHSPSRVTLSLPRVFHCRGIGVPNNAQAALRLTLLG